MNQLTTHDLNQLAQNQVGSGSSPFFLTIVIYNMEDTKFAETIGVFDTLEQATETFEHFARRPNIACNVQFIVEGPDGIYLDSHDVIWSVQSVN